MGSYVGSGVGAALGDTDTGAPTLGAAVGAGDGAAVGFGTIVIDHKLPGLMPARRLKPSADEAIPRYGCATPATDTWTKVVPKSVLKYIYPPSDVAYTRWPFAEMAIFLYFDFTLVGLFTQVAP